MSIFDTFTPEAKARRAAEVKASQLRNKSRFQTKPTTKPIYGASRQYLDRDWDGESLGQVYIGNKGWVGITPSGRVGYKTANGYTPIKSLTNYDKQQISLAINKTGVKALTGDRSREVANAWARNSKTWLATSRPSINQKPKVTQGTTKPQVPQQEKPNVRPTTQRTNQTKPTETRIQPRTSTSSNGFKTAWTNARNSGLGTFTWKGQSYNTMRKGESKQQYNTQLANQNKSTQQSKPIQETPGYGIHVGNNGVTLSTPNGQTTDITNSHNVSTLINNGNYKAPNLGTLPTNQLDNTPLSNYQELSKHNFNRADIRQGMRDNRLNPYSYSGSDRKQLRTYLNNPTTDNYTQSVSKIVGDGKVQQNMLNNAVQNQTDKYQLAKPQLVNLKFKQGGQMYKYQQGGPTQQAGGQQGMEQQAIALVQAAMQGNQQANQTIQQIMQAAQQGDQQALQVAQLLQAIIQKMKGSRKARLGAKLSYIRQSIGECPEGQELVYFKKGGEICRACQGKKMQNGGKSDPIKDFKKKKEEEELKKNYQRNPATRGKSAKEIAEMQRKNREEAGQGKGESPAPVAPWQYKKK